MIALAFAILFNPLDYIKDTADIVIHNRIEHTSIVSIHYLITGSRTMMNVGLERPVAPTELVTISLPYRHMRRLVFQTDQGDNYRVVSLTPGIPGDTIEVSRENREFGGFFDVILGERLFVLRNETPVNLASIFLHGDSLRFDLLGHNPLMHDETVFLWLNEDSITLTAVDIMGNESLPFHLTETSRDTLNTIRIAHFLGNAQPPPPGNVWIINCIHGEQLVEIEVYPEVGEPYYFDLRDTPLDLWQSAVIPLAVPINHIVCFDGEGRTYSIGAKDRDTGAYIAEWWNLDFDFSFPDRRQ